MLFGVHENMLQKLPSPLMRQILVLRYEKSSDWLGRSEHRWQAETNCWSAL